MFHIEDTEVRRLLLRGQFGLEKESLRVDRNGFLAKTPHPFPGNEHIVRDFCENQAEINTPVCGSAEEAVESLIGLDRTLQVGLAGRGELLWPFSNPPYIRGEKDIPIAQFTGEETGKTRYREYLSERYGRYRMSFSGIHVNFSFDSKLLRRDFALSGEADFAAYRDRLYLTLARRMVLYGWLLVAVTAASPLLDSSFVEKGRFDGDVFDGMASVRCSELGYWNFFTPVLDYSGLDAYADSIQRYVEDGWLSAPSELYYPIRLKPPGSNTLERLRKYGVNHIELRMFDLNPLAPAGVEVRDIQFAQLLLVWLASAPEQALDGLDQVLAVQNFKSAAHYDLKTVRIVAPGGRTASAVHAALEVFAALRDFYREAPEQVREVLAFQEEKFLDPETRYAWQLRRRFSGGFVKKGLALAAERQKEAIGNV